MRKTSDIQDRKRSSPPSTESSPKKSCHSSYGKDSYSEPMKESYDEDRVKEQMPKLEEGDPAYRGNKRKVNRQENPDTESFANSSVEETKKEEVEGQGGKQKKYRIKNQVTGSSLSSPFEDPKKEEKEDQKKEGDFGYGGSSLMHPQECGPQKHNPFQPNPMTAAEASTSDEGKNSSNSEDEKSDDSSSQKSRLRSNSCSSPLQPNSMTVAVASTPKASNGRDRKNEHIVVSVEGDEPYKAERLQTLHTLMSYLSSVSIKRDPTDVFDPFMSTLSVLMRLEVEAPHVLFAHRLLQEEALVDLVKKYPDHPLLKKPGHIEKLGELISDADINEILSVVVANLICPTKSDKCPTIPTISASNSYDVRDLMTTLMFLRSYEEILSKALICQRERLIGDIPQRIHVVAPQQNSVGSASSRGSHSSLLPHTENAYDPSEDIPQAFSLVCHRKGDQSTPTYILSLKGLIEDIGKVQFFFKEKSEKDEILQKFQERKAKEPELGSDLYSKNFDLMTSAGFYEQTEIAIYVELEDALKSLIFKMFEGPTMEKQASLKNPIFESSEDIDGGKNITFRFNGNIRESVSMVISDSDLGSFDPGSKDKSLTYYDPELVSIWRHFVAKDNAALNDLFPVNMFGSLDINQKQHNLKLLLALRTCPKDVGGVYLLRDFIYTLRFVYHGYGVEQLYQDLFIVADDAVKLPTRSLTSKPCPVEWESGVTAMFKNKEVLHYRAKFNQKFQSFESLEVSLTKQDSDCLLEFFKTSFGEDEAIFVADNFVDIVKKASPDEDGRYRFIKTFVNFVEFNQKLALCLLLPLNVQDQVVQDSTAFTLEHPGDTGDESGHFKYLFDTSHFKYLFNPSHFESAYLAELVRSYEQILPKIVDAYAKTFSSLVTTESESMQMTSLAKILQSDISCPDKKGFRQQKIAELIETRNSRCLIRNYFEDSDNSELPSPESFYAKMMHRTQSDSRLQDSCNKGVFSRILAYVKFLKYINIHGVEISPDSEEFKELNEILKGFEYEYMEPDQVLVHLLNVKSTYEKLFSKEDEDSEKPLWLHKKNIGRFTNQLDQFIVGCKVIKKLDDLLSDLSIDDLTTNKSIKLLILKIVISKFPIENQLIDDKLLEVVSEQQVLELSQNLHKSLSEADIDVINSFNSMPYPDRFLAFLEGGDQDNLEFFPFLEALEKEGVPKDVFKDSLFPSIVKLSMPSYHLKEDLKVGVLRQSKKSLIKRKDLILALKAEVEVSHGDELEESLKAKLLEIVSEKTAFLEQALTSSDIDIQLLDGDQIDYHINRWYDAEYVDFAKYDGAEDNFLRLSVESVVKIEKYLRFLKYNITKTETEGLIALSISPFVTLSFTRNHDGFIISNEDFQLLQKQFGFYISEGLYGDSDRLVFEKRLWLDEYIRDPIPEADKAKIQELIKQKSIFNIKTLHDRHQAIDYKFAPDEALEFLDAEINNLDLLLTTTNDMLMNYSATIPEKAFTLELALLDRFKKEKSNYYSVSNTNLIDLPDCEFVGDNVQFTYEQICLFMSMVGVKASYIKLGDTSVVTFGEDSSIEINYIMEQDRYIISVEALSSLPNVRIVDDKLYVQMFILNLKARDEVLAKNQVSIDAFKNRVNEIWSDSDIDDKSLFLKQAREQIFEDNTVVKRMDDSYIFTSDIFDELISKLLKRGCYYDKTQHKIVFWTLNTSIDDSEVLDVHEVQFNIESGNYLLSKDGFGILSSHFDLKFDDSKLKFYFGSTSINYTCKFASVDHVLQRSSNETYASLTLQDIVNNEFHDPSNSQELKDFLISSFNTEVFEKISIKRDFVFLRSREMFEELKGISSSLDQKHCQFLESKTRVFHRQKSYGINFVEDQASLLLDKVLKLDDSHLSFQEKITLWEQKVSDLSLDLDPSKRQDLTRFINHIKMWNMTVNNLREEIQELKHRKNLICNSFAISHFEGYEVEPQFNEKLTWFETVTANKFDKGPGHVDRLVDRSSNDEIKMEF